MNLKFDGDDGTIPTAKITNYWLLFNPKTGKGEVLLDYDGAPPLEQRIPNLSAQEFNAVAAVLSTGKAVLRADGAIYSRD